jgi:hypothetical protein
MRYLQALLLGVLFGFPVIVSGAQTAQARLYCLSLRFGEGATANGVYTMELTTDDPSALANGELAPFFGQFTHSSGFILHDPAEFEPVTGAIALDIPPATDVNQNGFADFFEVSQGASGTTTGAYATMVDDGSVRATWNRAAGSKDGTCVLRITSRVFGLLGDFTHPFELIEYTGPLTYTPGTNTVSGGLALVQTGNPQNRLGGPAEFARSGTNRFNEFELRPGAWTNAAGQSLTFSTNSMWRDDFLKTNYYGSMEFVDGAPDTIVEDYYTWGVSIDDLNDADLDGIPDFTDDPGSPSVRSPSLKLALGAGNIALTISGSVGRTHEIQQSDSLSPTNWSTASSVTLTNDPQTVTLPVPPGGSRFWRVHVP